MRALALAVLLAPASALAAATDVVINEVFYVGALTEDWIELKNTGPDSIDVETWWLCARGSLTQLAPLPLLDGGDWVLAPDEILAFGFVLNDVSSDLGIFLTPAFGDTAAMVDFVQWGTPYDVGGTDVAARKGIWTETGPARYDFVPTADPGQSAAYDGSNGGGGLLTLGSDFANGAPTRGRENGTNPVTAASWTRIKSFWR